LGGDEGGVKEGGAVGRGAATILCVYGSGVSLDTTYSPPPLHTPPSSSLLFPPPLKDVLRQELHKTIQGRADLEDTVTDLSGKSEALRNFLDGKITEVERMVASKAAALEITSVKTSLDDVMENLIKVGGGGGGGREGGRSRWQDYGGGEDGGE